MGHNAKNYTAQGGELTVIGGTLRIEGTLEYGEGAAAPRAANQAESDAATVVALKEDFNTLLAALKTAGLMEADASAQEPDPEPDPDPEETAGGGS